MIPDCYPPEKKTKEESNQPKKLLMGEIMCSYLIGKIITTMKNSPMVNIEG